MKGRQIIIDQIGTHRAAALLVDGVLDDLLVEAPGHVPLPGAIYRAVIMRPMKGLGGAFVRLEPKGQTGFLRQAKGLREGEMKLVQVTGFADPGKAPPVTTRLLFKSRYCIVTPDAPGLNVSRAIKNEESRARLHEIAADAALPADLGLILRSASAEGDDTQISEDIAAMADLANRVMNDQKGADSELLVEGPGPEELAWMEWANGETPILRGEGSFESCGVHDGIHDLLLPETRLRGSGRMFVEPTRAMVSVDIDTGGDSSPAAGLKTNLDAARTLPRVLRLRGLGGQLVVDAAPMPKKDRRTFEQALRASFRDDPIETALVGWTALGHYEFQRKRERLPLLECLP